MKLSRIWKIFLVTFVTFSAFVRVDSRPFMMNIGETEWLLSIKWIILKLIIGQAISGTFYGLWKLIDDTPPPYQNKTMKRAPAFASKYGKAIDGNKQDPKSHWRLFYKSHVLLYIQ